MSDNGIRKNLHAIPDPRRRAQELSRLVAEQQALLTGLAQLRRETIAELRAGGLTRAQVAEVLGVSPGRVAQLEPSPPASPTTPPAPVPRPPPPPPGNPGRHTLHDGDNYHPAKPSTRHSPHPPPD